MGHIWSAFVGEVSPPATKFHASDVPDMSGKVVLITGGNAGIGKETARALLTKNAKVYIACRDKVKAEATIRELKDATGNEPILLQLNLANLKSVKAAAEEFLKNEPRLDVLFNNAGVMLPPVDMLTDDGYDLQFGTNVLGHFYFTKLLMPALLAAAESSSHGTARVVNTASNAHWFSRLNYNSFRDSSIRRKMHSWVRYGQSKTGNIVFAAELARRYSDRGIISTSLHPGIIKTNLFRHQSYIEQAIGKLLYHDIYYGPLTQLYAGTAPEGEKLNGKYLVPWARVGTPLAHTQDPQIGKELWEWLEEQVKDI